jgi:hypothetical protein
MSEPTNTSTVLPALSWKILLQLLGNPGWAKTPLQIVVAGLFEESERVKLPEAPTPPISKEVDAAWCDTPVSADLTDKQKSVFKDCVEHFIAQGALSANKYAAKLVTAFVGIE